uniref:Uncharacterized protein n=1 Tax=Salix viminalis TaxID=40686 RepID=A0A6N2MEL7_SALVM
MLLHELFADADLLNEFPGHSILVTVRRKVVAFKPDSRLPNITLKLEDLYTSKGVSGTPTHNINQLKAIKHCKETECSIVLHSVLTSLISK